MKSRLLHLCPQKEPAHLERLFLAVKMRRASQPLRACTSDLVSPDTGLYPCLFSPDFLRWLRCGMQPGSLHLGPSRPGEFRLVSKYLPGLQSCRSPLAPSRPFSGCCFLWTTVSPPLERLPESPGLASNEASRCVSLNTAPGGGHLAIQTPSSFPFRAIVHSGAGCIWDLYKCLVARTACFPAASLDTCPPPGLCLTCTARACAL